MTKDIPLHAGLQEIRADLQKMHQEIATIWENWDATTVKLQGLDSEVENARAQIQATSQELTTQFIDHQTLLMK